MPEGPNVTWLRKHGYTDCPIASLDSKTALHDPKLMKTAARKIDNYVINLEASKDANFKPRCLVMKWCFVIAYRVKRFFNAIQRRFNDEN